MKYILYRSPSDLDKSVRQHELVAVEHGHDIDSVTPLLIKDVIDDLSQLPEYKHFEAVAYAPEQIHITRRVKRYQYEMMGVVWPLVGNNILIDYGIMEKAE